MEISGIPGAATSLAATQLSVDVKFSIQRDALDVASTQMAQLLESVAVPAGLTFGPDGPSKGDQRRVIATL
jgi:hypothetical protein